MDRRNPTQRVAAFAGQKGGVGKSALARLLAVTATMQGHKALLADFDLEQLTCVEWNATRRRRNVLPELQVDGFKSLKKLRKESSAFDLVIADTRGFADELTRDIAADCDTVFLPTGCSIDDLQPTMTLARRLAKHGAEGKIVLVLSKIGRSERQIAAATRRIAVEGLELLSEPWRFRESFQSELDIGRVGLESKNAIVRDAAQIVGDALLRRALAPSEIEG